MSSLEEKEYVRQLFPIVDQIKDQLVRDKVIEVWLRCWHESRWEKIELAGANVEIPPGRESLVLHTNFIASAALYISGLVRSTLSLPVNSDVLLAGALLHDVSKLNELGPDGEGGEQLTDIGSRIDHAAYGAYMALEVGLPLDIVHIIFSHTPLSASMPKSFEALIVSYADFLVSDLFYLDAGRRLLIAAHKKYRRPSVACHIDD